MSPGGRASSTRLFPAPPAGAPGAPLAGSRRRCRVQSPLSDSQRRAAVEGRKLGLEQESGLRLGPYEAFILNPGVGSELLHRR